MVIGGHNVKDVSDFWKWERMPLLDQHGKPILNKNGKVRLKKALEPKQGFDLMLPNRNGKCWLGNCDGCFLKSESSRFGLAREYPDRAKWWEDQEEWAKGLSTMRGQGWKFNIDSARKEYRELNEKQGDFFEEQRMKGNDLLCQAEGGECM